MIVTPMQAAKIMAETSGFQLSNLQIQKILYLAHMWRLYSRDGMPLITEHFEAWDYGPVVPSLYHKLKAYGAGPVKNIFRTTSVENVPEPTRRLLVSAVERFGNVPPGALVQLTHRDNGAWARNYCGSWDSAVIPNSDIREEAGELYGKSRAS